MKKKKIFFLSFISMQKENKSKQCSRRIDWICIIQCILKELEGRDKLIKTIQYFIKLLLHYQFKSARPYTPLVSQCSITRKILRLGNAIGPLREMKDADGKE